MESLLQGRVILFRGYFSPELSAEIFEQLRVETKWLTRGYENEDGQTRNLPRLTANYGERSYDYSGLTFMPEPFTPRLLTLKAAAEQETGVVFNALVLQLYRDGEDRVNWHADDSPLVGDRPTIASLSFGESRRFQLRHATRLDEREELTLHSGDLLVMKDDLQANYVHRVPKEANKGPRINLTFRRII